MAFKQKIIMRESGYYWVKIKTNEWIILWFSEEKKWWNTPFNLILNEEDFLEIGESKIQKDLLKKETFFSEREIQQLQSKIYKITGNGEIMGLFNELLGVCAG